MRQKLALRAAWHHGRMNKATWAMLNESEKALLRDADASSLARLDEEQLIDLHARVRRARKKYATLYRRRASSQVRADADRAKAHAQHARTAVKAEAFEDALARVSSALARAARASAAALRAERLETARRQPRSPRRPPTKRTRAKAPRGVRKAATRVRTPISERASASARSRTRRAQATRDAR
jgi:hypothetical protein